MFRRKKDKRIVELNPEELRLAKYALLGFRNKLVAPRKLRLNFVELFRRNDRLMAVFHIILRHLALIDLPLFCEEIDREAFLKECSALVFLVLKLMRSII